MGEKVLIELNKKAKKLIKKCDDKGHEFSDLELSIITNITRAESIKDVNGLAIYHFEKFCLEWGIG